MFSRIAGFGNGEVGLGFGLRELILGVGGLSIDRRTGFNGGYVFVL